MQRIIKNDQVVDESWHLLPKDATLDGLSNCDDLIVPLALWREHAHALKARGDAQAHDDGAQVEANRLLLRDEQHAARVDHLLQGVKLDVLGDHLLGKLDVLGEQGLAGVVDGRGDVARHRGQVVGKLGHLGGEERTHGTPL